MEMEELGMTLDRDEFVDAAFRLYEAVSLPERDILVNRKQRQRSNSARAVNDQFNNHLQRSK